MLLLILTLITLRSAPKWRGWGRKSQRHAFVWPPYFCVFFSVFNSHWFGGPTILRINKEAEDVLLKCKKIKKKTASNRNIPWWASEWVPKGCVVACCLPSWTQLTGWLAGGGLVGGFQSFVFLATCCSFFLQSLVCSFVRSLVVSLNNVGHCRSIVIDITSLGLLSLFCLAWPWYHVDDDDDDDAGGGWWWLRLFCWPSKPAIGQQLKGDVWL